MLSRERILAYQETGGTVDCGPQSLKYVLNMDGKKVSLKRLRELCHTNRNGTRPGNLADAAFSVGYEVFTDEGLWIVDLNRFINRGSRVIVDWQYVLDRGMGKDYTVNPEGHFSVFLGSHDRVVSLWDPYVRGVIIIPNDHFQKMWYDTSRSDGYVQWALVMDKTW